MLNDEADLACYGCDASDFEVRPKEVVIAKSVDDVVNAVLRAREKNWKIVARGAGSSVCGQPLCDGIIVDMSQMKKIIEISSNYVHVESGITPFNLNRELGKKGLFFPPDPSSNKQCTIGGMIANNASGIHTVKYGVTRDYILGLEVVLANGSIVKTGTKSLKNTAGYDLNSLFCGSEGTLGIITKAILRILPKPKNIKRASAKFRGIKEAVEATFQIIERVRPAALEILDDVTCKAIGIDADAMLLIETDGTSAEEEMEEIGKIVKLESGEYWENRRNVTPKLAKYSKDNEAIALAEDIGVPVDKLSETISGLKKIYEKYNLTAAIFGHAGDGNLHTRVLNKSPPDVQKEVYEFVLSLGGTMTAEHGIGLLRKEYLSLEAKESIAAMKRIKKSFDPGGRFPSFL